MIGYLSRFCDLGLVLGLERYDSHAIYRYLLSIWDNRMYNLVDI